MNSRHQREKKMPADSWQAFVQAEVKTGSNLGKLFQPASFGGYENKTLTLYFPDEESCKKAKGKSEPLKKKLPSILGICDRIEFCVGEAPVNMKPTVSKPVNQNRKQSIANPLQALNYAEFGRDKDNELTQPVLEEAVKAEKACATIYEKLRERTLQIAGGEENVLAVSFEWRVRVGGTRGFRELLLPVLHPVFGIPYIPASSLKGAARAWATQSGNSQEARQLLGFLEGNQAKAAQVEFLDAFPTKPCLVVDVATPQWHWQENRVVYKPEPHPLLGMEQPQFLIGLRSTASNNSKQSESAPNDEERESIQRVKGWLENALNRGIGSRVSSGYGRTLGYSANLSEHSKSYDFELWTQGMYGCDPYNPEFRPTAIRGILRYWFRAVAMKLYDAETCQQFEETTFGKLGQQGRVVISTRHNSSQRQNSYCYTGKIILKILSNLPSDSKIKGVEQKYLKLIEQLLLLASHLGGVGRGSRRPLHLLDIGDRQQMRGCHWTVETPDRPVLKYGLQEWQKLFADVETAFKALQPSSKSYTSSPGSPGKDKNQQSNRRQDVLDKQAQVWLIKSPQQISPDRVKDWWKEGDQDAVRGSGLSLLYGNESFKGENRDGKGNKNVGGALGTPSFVWIKSMFPADAIPYQVITIFGTDNSDRKKLSEELNKLAKTGEALLVYREISSGHSSNKPTIKRK